MYGGGGCSNSSDSPTPVAITTGGTTNTGTTTNPGTTTTPGTTTNPGGGSGATATFSGTYKGTVSNSMYGTLNVTLTASDGSYTVLVSKGNSSTETKTGTYTVTGNNLSGGKANDHRLTGTTSDGGNTWSITLVHNLGGNFTATSTLTGTLTKQ